MIYPVDSAIWRLNNRGQVSFFPFCLGDDGKDHCGFFLVSPMGLAHVFLVLWHQASILLSRNCLIYWLKHYSPRLNPADGSNITDECWGRMHIYSRIIRKNNWYNLIIHTIQTITSTLHYTSHQKARLWNLSHFSILHNIYRWCSLIADIILKMQLKNIYRPWAIIVLH